MNQGHLEFLASPRWAEMLETDLLPWVERVGDLGDHVLEIGPGPGLTTDLLRPRVRRITAVEVDPALAGPLAERLAGTNVTVLCADATHADLPEGAFSAVVCFSMLHHMPSASAQDRLFAEVARVLRPGGMFIGVDSVDSEPIRQAHADDTFIPVDPDHDGRPPGRGRSRRLRDRAGRLPVPVLGPPSPAEPGDAASSDRGGGRPASARVRPGDAPGAQQPHELGGHVGHDPVDPEVEEAHHRLGVVDRPDVDGHARAGAAVSTKRSSTSTTSP